MTSHKTTVLIVDDDIRMRGLLKNILEVNGYRILMANNGETAINTFFETEIPDLVVLDIVMPGMDGYKTCRRIREFSRVPVIMVTAKDDDTSKVEGLYAGADDFITKPFSAKELLARVMAVLRRTVLWEEKPESAFHCADLTIDFSLNKVIRDKRDVPLTAVEHKVLSYLARNANRVVTPDQILEKVWGEEYLGETNILHATITRLRKKLNDSARHPRYIFTRPGIGYTMAGGN
jgi:DNA-binding response OmpR family regulator